MDEDSSLALEPRPPKHMALVVTAPSGARSEIRLTAGHLLLLHRELRQLLGRISGLQLPKAQALAERSETYLPVTAVQISDEILRPEILLTVTDFLGGDYGYAIPLDLAKRLAERLLTRIAHLEQTQRDTTKQ